MKNIALFCGSSAGNNAVYSNSAKELTRQIVARQHNIITGGGHVGIMGEIADEAIKLGGYITGVIPQFLVNKEVAHGGLNEMIIVESMHERKQKIESLADAFIALPGGFGTLDELFEMITWAQLSIHKKPCGIFNVNGFFDNVITHIHHMIKEGFVAAAYLDMIIIESDPEKLLSKMMAFEPKEVDKAKIALGRQE